jgi:hypothetical protein
MERVNKHTNIDEIKAVVDRYPWWSAARLTLARNQSDEERDAATRLIASLHPTALATLRTIDTAQLTHLTTDDLIDRFLKRSDYRIVAEEGTAEDLSEVEIEDDEDMISEDLAEIYKKQGLYCEAIAIYRKLSLLNSEKSIYFAELIAEIEDKMNRK